MNYNILFLNTSHIIDGEESYFKLINNYTNKTIFIHHYDKCFFKKSKFNIIVTPLLKRFLKKKIKNNINYILPIFKSINLSNKKHEYLFGFIGNMRHRNLEKFKKILDLSNIYNFKILYIGNYYGIEKFNFNNYINMIILKI